MSYTVTAEREVSALVLETALPELPPPKHVDRRLVALLTLDAHHALGRASACWLTA